MIVGTFNKIPKKLNSHSYGWARTWSENLGIDIDHTNGFHDEVFLLHGANFAGALNLFGGFTDELKQSVDNLMQATTIYSLEQDCPDYGAMLKKRNDVKDKDWCDQLSAKLAQSTVLKQTSLDKKWLAVGDSHTAAYSRPGSAVVKRDGTTLFGQIKDNFKYIEDTIKECRSLDGVTISLGNIDIRHHVCRHDVDMNDLVEPLHQFAKQLPPWLDVEFAMPWPIEHEERKLPKTGWYKGTPFAGSRAERQSKVQEMFEAMTKREMTVVEYPVEWTIECEQDGEAYAKKYMEGRQSVHLNPEFYRRKDWGVVENSLESFFG